MSADNYNLVRRHPNGGYVVTECSASTDPYPIESTDKRFPTREEAIEWALNEGTEYGVELDDEPPAPQGPFS